MWDVRGKGVCITGGAKGIGLGIAKAFVAAGANVVITYKREAGLEEALRVLRTAGSGSATAVHLDVTDRNEVLDVAEQAERALGRVHILCNNAGVNLFGPMDRATFSDWDWLLGVNLMGIANTLVAFLPRIRAHGERGHVLNVASMSAFVAGPMAGIYATTKFAVRGLSDALWYSLAPQGIGVSVLCPGLTRTTIYDCHRARPEHLRDTNVVVDELSTKGFKAVHSLGMDADEVGRKAVAGVREGRFYIFSHPEFQEELRELTQEIFQAFTPETPEPSRNRFERGRYLTTAELRRNFGRGPQPGGSAAELTGSDSIATHSVG